MFVRHQILQLWTLIVGHDLFSSFFFLDSKFFFSFCVSNFSIWLFFQGIIFVFVKHWGVRSSHLSLIKKSFMKFSSHFWMQSQMRILSSLASTLMTIPPYKKEIELVLIVIKFGCIPLLMQLKFFNVFNSFLMLWFVSIERPTNQEDDMFHFLLIVVSFKVPITVFSCLHMARLL